MTQEPDTPSPDPVLPTSGPGPETPNDPGGRWVTIVAWGAGLVTITVLAALVAAGIGRVQNTRFEIRQVEDGDPGFEVEVVPPQALPDPPPVETRADGVVVRNPTWIAAPRVEYPQLALNRGVEAGLVELECRIRVTGRIDRCAVLNETPTGAGFAEAAIAAAGASRLRPREIDGVPVESSIRYTTRFSLE